LTIEASTTDRDDADRVQIHWLDLADATPADERRWLEFLDETERARAARFFHDRDRLAFAAAHALLRAMLSRALGAPPHIWRFVQQAHGKPSLDPAFGIPSLEFNLSHTRGAVACAVTHGRPVGVDIEGESRDIELLALARAYFAPAEVALLEALAEKERAGAFFQLWTLKEAYVKARGDGLSLAFDRFAFSLDPIGVDLPDAPPEEPSMWRFSSVLLSGRRRLSAAARSDRPVRFDIRRMSPSSVDAIAAPASHPNRDPGDRST
jgi:4'-phosphopantetheinyl transferase